MRATLSRAQPNREEHMFTKNFYTKRDFTRTLVYILGFMFCLLMYDIKIRSI